MPAAARIWIPPAIIIGVWIVIEIVVDPRGDFPLNDDWLFGILVRRLLAGDGFQPGSLPNMTLFSHIAWGTAACAPFDCSDQTLRMVTIVWGVGGALLVYALLRLVQATPLLAVIGTLSITLNPLYLELSNSFMTDVPFTGMFVLAAICFMRDLRRPSTLALATGTFIACSATLSRQIGLAVPLSFLICTIVMVWLRPQAGRLGAVIRASVPVVACLAAFVGFETWLSRAHGLPPGQAEATIMLLQAMGKPLFFVYHVASQGLVAAPYLGWFLTPILLLVSPASFSLRCRNWPDIAALGLAMVIGGLIIVTVIQAGHGMPLYRNVIIPQGLGPLTLHDAYPYGPGTLKLQPIAPLPWQVWFVITAVGFCGAVALAAALAAAAMTLARSARATTSTDGPFFLFLLLCTGLYLVPMFLTNWYDRYLLPVLPLLLATLCMNRTIALAPGAFRVLKATAACLILLGTGALSVFGTADYLAWNRARWTALADLVNSDQATPQQIDGGLEFNGVYTITPDYQASPGKSWWWVNDDLYVIAFAPLPGRQLVKAYPFKSWLHPIENRIVVLRRTQ